MRVTTTFVFDAHDFKNPALIAAVTGVVLDEDAEVELFVEANLHRGRKATYDDPAEFPEVTDIRVLANGVSINREVTDDAMARICTYFLESMDQYFERPDE